MSMRPIPFNRLRAMLLAIALVPTAAFCGSPSGAHASGPSCHSINGILSAPVLRLATHSGATHCDLPKAERRDARMGVTTTDLAHAMLLGVADGVVAGTSGVIRLSAPVWRIAAPLVEHDAPLAAPQEESP